MVDRTNHHLFQPLLYQVAAGILSPGLIAPALRGIIKKQRNARALLAEVNDLDLDAQGGARAGPGRPRRSTCPTTRWSSRPAPRTPTSARTSSPSSRPGMKTIEDARYLRDAHPVQVRDGRAGHRPAGARRVADVRGDRRGPDRCRAGRPDRRAGAHGAAAGLPLGQHHARRGSSCWRARRRCCRRSTRSCRTTRSRQLEKMGVEVRLNSLAVDMDHESITVKGPDGVRDDPGPHPDLGRRRAGLAAGEDARREDRRRDRPGRPGLGEPGLHACPGTPRCSRSATWCR